MSDCGSEMIECSILKPPILNVIGHRASRSRKASENVTLNESIVMGPDSGEITITLSSDETGSATEVSETDNKKTEVTATPDLAEPAPADGDGTRTRLSSSKSESSENETPKTSSSENVSPESLETPTNADPESPRTQTNVNAESPSASEETPSSEAVEAYEESSPSVEDTDVLASPGNPEAKVEPPKEKYPIEIPLKKKIGGRAKRKLWEEIERRKPVIPTHVAAHIQKYAKPPFDLNCKKKQGKGGTCFGCQ